MMRRPAPTRRIVLLLCFVAALAMLSVRRGDSGFHFRLDLGVASLSVESDARDPAIGITLAVGGSASRSMLRGATASLSRFRVY